MTGDTRTGVVKPRFAGHVRRGFHHAHLRRSGGCPPAARVRRVSRLRVGSWLTCSGPGCVRGHARPLDGPGAVLFRNWPGWTPGNRSTVAPSPPQGRYGHGITGTTDDRSDLAAVVAGSRGGVGRVDGLHELPVLVRHRPA